MLGLCDINLFYVRFNTDFFCSIKSISIFFVVDFSPSIPIIIVFCLHINLINYYYIVHNR